MSGEDATPQAYAEYDAWAAAGAYGIDLDQLEDLLSLTPTERFLRHQRALELVRAVRQAGIDYYGFDPRTAEAPE